MAADNVSRATVSNGRSNPTEFGDTVLKLDPDDFFNSTKPTWVPDRDGGYLSEGSKLAIAIKSSLGRPTKSNCHRLGQTLLKTILMAISCVCAVTIYSYEGCRQPSTNHRPNVLNKTCVSTSGSVGTSFTSHPIDGIMPMALLEPSPRHFVLASFIYGASTASYCHLSQQKKRDFSFLGTAVICSIGAGLVTARDLRASFLEFMPWFIIVFLVLGALWQQFESRNRGLTSLDIEEQPQGGKF